tara:strand:+ start:715 stop:1596 length:882 start_codon:yes stop_codon:yes gene_type:complete
MAKLNVDEIEANGTNSNVKVTTKGTDGSCEIKAATNDATLQLNCSAQSHGVKLKAPANTAGQNYTMILPDNQIAANKLLKVKSVSNNVGQLEYADPTSQTISSLNADNITSGSLPAARFPTFSGSSGAALELVSEQTVGSTAVSGITFTGLEDDTMYKMVATHLRSNVNAYNYMYWLDASNNNQTGFRQEYFYYQSSSIPDRALSNTGSALLLNEYSKRSISFVADISNIAANNWMIIHGFITDYPMYGKFENYVTFDSSSSTKRIHGIKVESSGISTYTEGSKILLYKYKES